MKFSESELAAEDKEIALVGCILKEKSSKGAISSQEFDLPEFSEINDDSDSLTVVCGSNLVLITDSATQSEKIKLRQVAVDSRFQNKGFGR